MVPKIDQQVSLVWFRKKHIILGALAVLLIAPPIGLTLAWMVFSEYIKPILSSQFAFSMIIMGLSLFLIIHLCAACILAERKLSAYIQDRQGPNRVGWGGVLQPIADGLKFMLKEDIVPANVEKPVFILAPCLAFIVALVGFAVIPWAGTIEWPWTNPDGTPAVVHTQVAQVDIGVLYMLAVGAMSVYGVVLAGWASNNKYAHFGGMRAAAQMLSYEVPLGLGILILLISSGTLRLEEIVDQQAKSGVWNALAHPIAFILVLITAFAETNRAPFDLAECEQELVAGFHTEYSSMKFALFFLGEYAHMITNSALMTVLFLGGWAILPGVTFLADNNSWWAALIKFNIVWGKILGFVAFYMIIRWTLPRFRFDQLMRLSWKGLVPLGMIMVLVTILMTAAGFRLQPEKGFAGNLVYLVVMFGVNAAVIGFTLWFNARTQSPITGRQGNLPDVRVAPR